MRLTRGLAGCLALLPSLLLAGSDPLRERLRDLPVDLREGRQLAPEEIAELRALVAAEGPAVAADLECALDSGGANEVADQLVRLERRVGAVRAGQAAAAAVPADGRGALTRVLMRREFAGLSRIEPAPASRLPPPWLDRFLQWLERQMQRIKSWMERHSPGSGLAGSGGGLALGARAVAYGVLGLVLVLIAIAAARWVAERYRRPQPVAAARPAGRPAGGVEAVLARGPEDWWSLAEAQLAAGDAAGACRAIYLALLVALHRAGITEVKPSRTNWEHARRVERRLPRAAPEFRELTRTFDRVVYGGRPAGVEDYAAARARAEAVLLGLEAWRAETAAPGQARS